MNNTINLKQTRNGYIWQSLLIALFLFGLIVSVTFIVPDFLGHNAMKDGHLNNYWNYLTIDLMHRKNGDSIAAGFFITFWFIGNLSIFIFLFWFSRAFIVNFTYKRWIKRYSNLCAEVINHADLSSNPKVAMIVYVCNDLTPTTILQTANQTYKNIDVWLLDDSSKPEAIQRVASFAQEHGYRVCHRVDEHKKAHPTMIGNMFYFLGLHAKEYDFIFETGTSTITTNTFVENGLKYFYSSLLDGSKIGAVSGCGSFYPSRNLFSYMSGVSLQWGDANLNGSGFRSTGTQMYVNGWAALYKSSVLASIPLHEIECPSCDVARSYWMALHSIDACFNPFDFTGKLNTQNIYRFKNQRMKWAGGDSFIFKHYWSKRYPDKNVNFFVKIHLFAVVIVYLIGIIGGILTIILLASCPALNEFGVVGINYSSLMVGCILGGTFGIFVIISWIIYKPNLRVIFLTLLASLFDMAILFKKGYKLLIPGLILGKWSSKSVTIKTTERMSFKQWFKVCWPDMLFFIIMIGLMLVLTYCTNIKTWVVWGPIFIYLTLPSILWLIASILSYIPYKKGWDDSLNYYDIAKNDYRYTYIKQTEIWQKQHPSN